MFVASLISNARPVAVLLGGSGISRTAAPPKRDMGALLRPGQPYAKHDASGSVSAATNDPLAEGHRHD